MSPWVEPDGPRDRMTNTAEALAPGSGSDFGEPLRRVGPDLV